MKDLMERKEYLFKLGFEWTDWYDYEYYTIWLGFWRISWRKNL